MSVLGASSLDHVDAVVAAVRKREERLSKAIDRLEDLDPVCNATERAIAAAHLLEEVVRADRAFADETAAAALRMQARDQEHVVVQEHCGTIIRTVFGSVPCDQPAGHQGPCSAITGGGR